VEVNGKTLGIIGAGNIGRAVIKIAKALDMDILVYTRTPREDSDGIRYVDLDTLLANSDYISLHCPLTPQTRHIINKETLSKMKPSAFLVNTSRGALVDEPALIEALQNGVIAGAALDVQETEPPADDNPLYTLDNVILNPHMGWKGLETRQRLVSILDGNIKAFFAGNPRNVVS
jgi:glycerate dehydrogenase